MRRAVIQRAVRVRARFTSVAVTGLPPWSWPDSPRSETNRARSAPVTPNPTSRHRARRRLSPPFQNGYRIPRPTARASVMGGERLACRDAQLEPVALGRQWAGGVARERAGRALGLVEVEDHAPVPRERGVQEASGPVGLPSCRLVPEDEEELGRAGLLQDRGQADGAPVEREHRLARARKLLCLAQHVRDLDGGAGRARLEACLHPVGGIHGEPRQPLEAPAGGAVVVLEPDPDLPAAAMTLRASAPSLTTSAAAFARSGAVVTGFPPSVAATPGSIRTVTSCPRRTKLPALSGAPLGSRTREPPFDPNGFSPSFSQKSPDTESQPSSPE